MSIKLGIYDFFSYTIPGGVVTAAVLFVLIKHFGLVIDFGNLSIIEFVAFITLAYLMGYANDYIAKKTWYKIFRRKKLFETTMIDFNKRNPSVEALYQEMDLYIPFYFIEKQSLDMAQDIEKLNAQSIMLRNSSFGILMFAIIFAVEFFLSGNLPVYAFSSVLCFIVSVILAHESVKFATWFYLSIYQSLTALLVKPEQLPIKFLQRKKLLKQQNKE
jgi:hypothetical protein